MTFSEEQLLPTNKDSIELRLKDKGKLTDKPLTSDEALHEISNLKENITRELLMTIKQTSIDCKLHKANNNGEPILCYNINNANINKFNSLILITKFGVFTFWIFIFIQFSLGF